MADKIEERIDGVILKLVEKMNILNLNAGGGLSNVIQVSFYDNDLRGNIVTLPFGAEETLNNNSDLYELDGNNLIKVKADGLYRIELVASRSQSGAMAQFTVASSRPFQVERVILNPQSMSGDMINVSDVRIYELTANSLVYVKAIRFSGTGAALVRGRLIITKID